VLAGPLANLLAPGLPADARAETQTLILLMLPLVVTFGTGTYFGSIFAAHSLPVPAEFVVLFSRLGVLVYGLFALNGLSLVQVAAALVVCSIVALAVQWVILVRVTGLRYSLRINLSIPEMRDTGLQALGFVAVAVVAQLDMSYLQRLATLDGPSTVAALSYAFSIVAPLGLVLGKLIAFSTGPRYIDLFERGRSSEASRLLLKYGLISLVITSLLVAIVATNASQLVLLLYGGGRFDARSVQHTVDVTWPIMWSLPGSVLLWVLLFPLLNKSKSQVGAFIYIAGYVAQILINWLLFEKFGQAVLTWGFSGCVTLQAAMGVVYMTHMFRRKSKV